VRLKAFGVVKEIIDLKISIPSGAIKRVMKCNPDNTSQSFQFLLVRLKVSTSKTVQPTTGISIPSGAIKRNPETKKWDVISEFQFLLVRLKVGARKKARKSSVISIPSGAIKRNNRFVEEKRLPYFNSFWCD